MKKLYAEHHAWALRTAKGIIGDTHDAEDVVSEVFLAIHKAKAAGGGPTTNVRAYLRRAIQNEATRVWTRRRFEQVVEEIPDQATPDPVEAMLRALQRKHALRDAPPLWPLAIYHVDILGEPAEAFAEQYDLTVSSAKSLLHRAREAVRKAA